jgi:AraC-like DNA-binding protein/mannose-6-phosphate isomerase-like protein (cupin superfamily)
MVINLFISARMGGRRMYNVPLNEVDNTPRAVVAIGTDYSPGTLLARHSHRRAQFLYGISGVMEVSTDDGAWVVPTRCGVWIPAGKSHQVLMAGVSTRSLYIEADSAPRQNPRCEVLAVSPLLHQLLLEAVDLELLYSVHGRDDALIRLLLCELNAAPVLPFFAPLPRDTALARRCSEFMKAPSIRSQPESWAAACNKSPRSFSRFFRQQTGMAFSQWRQRACLLYALPAIAAGRSVTAIALDLGYESTAAFSAMFRRCMGTAPSSFSRYRQR